MQTVIRMAIGTKYPNMMQSDHYKNAKTTLYSGNAVMCLARHITSVKLKMRPRQPTMFTAWRRCDTMISSQFFSGQAISASTVIL